MQSSNASRWFPQASKYGKCVRWKYREPTVIDWSIMIWVKLLSASSKAFPKVAVS